MRLIDPYGRHIRYLRVSVTDRCNFRCFYCMPDTHSDFRERKHLLTFEEIERIVGTFVSLGVNHVRITGGEPLVRRNVLRLIGRIGALPGLHDLSMTTNGAMLAASARELRAAGVRRLNVSLDTLKADRFRDLTRGGDLFAVLNGLQQARQAGFDLIKINCVALRGINDDEFDALVGYCIANDFTLRFIETMPMGDLGYERQQYYLPLTEVIDRLRERFDLRPAVVPGGGPADYFQVAGSRVRIGFITPISRHFCASCNRVRLTADGMLFLCLGQEHSLDVKTPLRQGCSDADLAQLLRAAVQLKPERHEFVEEPGKIIRIMSATGG